MQTTVVFCDRRAITCLKVEHLRSRINSPGRHPATLTRFATIRFGDLFSCRKPAGAEIIFSLTRKYLARFQFMSCCAVREAGLPLTNSLSSTEKWQRNAIPSGWPMGAGKAIGWAPVSSTTQYGILRF